MSTAVQPIKHEFTALLGGEDAQSSSIVLLRTRIPLTAYIPVNVYVPLLCMMMDDSANGRAGTRGVASPLAAGSLTYTINGVEITWIPAT